MKKIILSILLLTLCSPAFSQFATSKPKYSDEKMGLGNGYKLFNQAGTKRLGISDDIILSASGGVFDSSLFIDGSATIRGTTSTTITAASLNDVILYNQSEQSIYIDDMPSVVAVHITAAGVYLYDHDDFTLWKTISDTAGQALPAVDPRTGDFKEGILTIGCSTGAYIFDFVNDTFYRINTSGLAIPGAGKTLDDVNTSITYTVIDSSLALVNAAVNDVQVQTHNNKIYINAATDGGVSIVNWTDGSVVDITDGTYVEAEDIYMTRKGEIYFTVSQSGQNPVRMAAYYSIPTVDDTNLDANADYFYVNGTVPLATIGTMNAIGIKENANLFGYNQILIAGNNGLLILDEKQLDESNSAVQLIAKDNNPGLLFGDIRAAFDFDADTSSIGYDHSVNSATITWTGTPTFVSGIYNEGVQLDGSTQYGTVYDSAVLSPTGAMTISVWCAPDDGQTGTTSLLFSKGYTSGARSYYAYQGSDGRIDFIVSSNGTTVAARSSSFLFPNGATQKTHVVLVYNPSTNLDIYINGVLSNGALSGSIPSSIYDTATNLSIGSTDVPGNYFDGFLDQLNINAKALTADEIKYMYEHGLAAHRNHTAIDGASNANGLQLLQGASTSQVNALATDKTGDVYIGTQDGGLMQWDTNGAGMKRVWNTTNSQLTANDITAVAAYGIPRSATAEAPGGLSIGVDTGTDYVLLERNYIDLLALAHESTKPQNRHQEIYADRLYPQTGNRPVHITDNGLYYGDSPNSATTVEYILHGAPGEGYVRSDGFLVNSDATKKADIREISITERSSKIAKLLEVEPKNYKWPKVPQPKESDYVKYVTDEIGNVTPIIRPDRHIPIYEQIGVDQKTGEPIIQAATLVLDATEQFQVDNQSWEAKMQSRRELTGIMAQDVAGEFGDGDYVDVMELHSGQILSIQELFARVEALEAENTKLKVDVDKRIGAEAVKNVSQDVEIDDLKAKVGD